MQVEFASDYLRELADGDREDRRLEEGVVKAYRKRVALIRSALDERDLRKLKSAHFEKLKGDREGQHSLRLNDQWRLILEIVDGTPKIIKIVNIEDYH